jgi:hypothetical protein
MNLPTHPYRSDITHVLVCPALPCPARFPFAFHGPRRIHKRIYCAHCARGNSSHARERHACTRRVCQPPFPSRRGGGGWLLLLLLLCCWEKGKGREGGGCKERRGAQRHKEREKESRDTPSVRTSHRCASLSLSLSLTLTLSLSSAVLLCTNADGSPRREGGTTRQHDEALNRQDKHVLCRAELRWLGLPEFFFALAAGLAPGSCAVACCVGVRGGEGRQRGAEGCPTSPRVWPSSPVPEGDARRRRWRWRRGKLGEAGWFQQGK